jgi:pimeloyl-ACP methyl ester carboxylesterase
MNDWMNRCLSGLDGDPRFYTTAEAMRDLDETRAVLGYDKINLYGISYGVIAAQVYMRMFPERVRTVVLDHGTALDLPFIQLLPRVSQAALDQVFTYCEQDEKCHVAYPDIRGDWKAVLSRLAKGPVVTSYTAPGATGPAEVNMDGLASAVHKMMFNYGTYSQIPFIVHTLATSEDWTAVVKNYNEQHASDNSGEDNRLLLMKSIIFCFEPSWGDLPDEIARLNPNSYYRDLEVKDAQLQQKICAALPVPDPSLIYGPGKPAPLSALMLNGLLDPQNPPSNMDPALKEFTKSRLVVEPTAGHENSTSSICRWDIIAQYIQQGSVDGLDVSCMEKQKPSFVIAD